MRNYLSLHLIKLSAFIASSIAPVILFIYQYPWKSGTEINPLDILGEGALVFVFGLWIAVILLSRPRGIVTNTLFWGLLFLYLAAVWDLLDEFFLIDHYYLTMKVLESMPSLVGVLVLSGGLYLWKQEQDYFNASRIKHEKDFRDHASHDVFTGINNAQYMEDFLTYTVTSSHHTASGSIFIFDVVMMDRERDSIMPPQVMIDLVNVTGMSIRSNDLICRYSGQRFVVYFDQLSHKEALTLANGIQQSIEALTYFASDDRAVRFRVDGAVYEVADLVEKNQTCEPLLRHMIRVHNSALT
ncbi:GGDEF domain-containing protein [Arenicella chitinivorans]|nr:diguanylate cyclase [Arenicella chitinivorans]